MIHGKSFFPKSSVSELSALRTACLHNTKGSEQGRSARQSQVRITTKYEKGKVVHKSWGSSGKNLCLLPNAILSLSNSSKPYKANSAWDEILPCPPIENVLNTVHLPDESRCSQPAGKEFPRKLPFHQTTGSTGACFWIFKEAQLMKPSHVEGELEMRKDMNCRQLFEFVQVSTSQGVHTATYPIFEARCSPKTQLETLKRGPTMEELQITI